MFQYSSASDDNHDNEPLLKKLCLLLCMPQNAPECASEHIKLLKISWSVPPNPPIEQSFQTAAAHLGLECPALNYHHLMCHLYSDL